MEMLTSQNVPLPLGHYSHAVCANGFIFLSGILADKKPPVGEMPSFEEQTRIVFAYCQDILAERGASIKDVVSTTIYVTDLAKWGACNSIYAEIFGDHKPARTIVPVPVLGYGFSIEVQMVALDPKK